MTRHASYDEPWALSFLPSGRQLITERSGKLYLRMPWRKEQIQVEGVPPVAYGGQGGLGDVALSPDFTLDRTVYLSWAEPGAGGTSGAAVGKGRLVRRGDVAWLADFDVIWRQQPKVTGTGHFSHRLAFSPDGQYLFVSSGDRQKMDPAQDLGNTLGTIVRLTRDGEPAPGNPFAGRPGADPAIWSYGHRNPLGLQFDAAGRLWSTEMGPEGGDELNVIEPGGNYGWPWSSNGSHYGGGEIPDDREGDGYVGPKRWWTPSISPGNLLIYSGFTFPQWRGDALIGGMSTRELIRVELNGGRAGKATTYPWGRRIRDIDQAPDGTIWLLEEQPGALVQLTPR